MTAKSWTPPKPYPYETPKRTCRASGCLEEPTTHAPLHIGHGGADFCEEHAKQQEAAVVREQLYALKSAHFRMFHWTLETWPSDDAVAAEAKREALDWLKELGADRTLFIWGSVGSGKTGLAWSLLVETIQGSGGFDRHDFVNVRQLLSRMRRSFGSDEPYDPMDELTNETWLLVLDDLGAERVTDWTREWLATLIEGRYMRERPTIVTSNYSPSQLARRLGHDDPTIGKRIVSRLVEGAVVIKLDRPDLRLRDAA